MQKLKYEKFFKRLCSLRAKSQHTVKAKESHANYPINPREPKITYACMAQNANDGKIDQSKGKTRSKYTTRRGGL